MPKATPKTPHFCRNKIFFFLLFWFLLSFISLFCFCPPYPSRVIYLLLCREFDLGVSCVFLPFSDFMTHIMTWIGLQNLQLNSRTYQRANTYSLHPTVANW